jgi:hypothetical protein
MVMDKGPKAVAVMWAMTVLSFILVPLRLYTRIFIIKALGLDDHVFNLGWVRSYHILYRILHELTDAGLLDAIHRVSHHFRTARIREAHHYLVHGRGGAGDLHGNGRANVCRPGNGDRQAVSGYLPPPHRGQDMASSVDLGINGQPVYRLGPDSRDLLDPAAAIKFHL